MPSVEKCRLDVGDFVRMGGREVGSGGQPGAAPQLARLPPAGVPFSGGGDKPALHRPAGGILLQPGPQPGPLTKQRLVRDLDVVCADAEQPGLREWIDDRAHAPIREGAKLGERHSAPRRCITIARAGQPTHQDRCRSLKFGVECPICALRHPCDSATDPAGRDVCGQREAVAVTLLPELGQGRGQQGQRPGLIANVCHQGIGESDVEVQACALSGEFDGSPCLCLGWRPDEDGHVAQGVSERGMVGEFTQVVSTYHENERATRVGLPDLDDGVEEGRPLPRVGTGRPRLLQLVDDQDDSRCRAVAVHEASEQIGDPIAVRLSAPQADPGQLTHWVWPGTHGELNPSFASRKRTCFERGNQAREHQRGLATAGGADDSQQLRRRDPGEQLSYLPLTASEPRLVSDAVRSESLPGAGVRCRKRLMLIDVVELADAFP